MEDTFRFDSLLFGLSQECKVSIKHYQIGMVAFYKQLVEHSAKQE